MSKSADLHVLAPTAWGTATSTGTSTTATAISSSGDANAGVARKLWVKVDTKTHIIFGGSGVTAATISHGYLTADVDYVLDVPAGVTHFRNIKGSGAADGNIFYAAVS